MRNSDGEIKVLYKISLLILVLTAIVAPWIYHDRAITALNVKIDNLTLQQAEIKKILNAHIGIITLAPRQFDIVELPIYWNQELMKGNNYDRP